MGADLQGNLLAVNDESLGLKVGLPNFLGVTLGKADITAVLLALAGEFTSLHGISLHFLAIQGQIISVFAHSVNSELCLLY